LGWRPEIGVEEGVAGLIDWVEQSHLAFDVAI
jgi:nucleoside-diphosphate-sugar epimerase